MTENFSSLIKLDNVKPLTRRPLNDIVYTDAAFAKRLIDHFAPTGKCLDPCRGAGAFFNSLPEPKDWCEIQEGRDFLDYKENVDFIITNPPWSSKAYRAISQHAFDIATNVVFLIRLHNAIGTFARHNDFTSRGHGIKEIVVATWKDAGIKPEGFVLAAFHWQKDYNNGTTWTYWNE